MGENTETKKCALPAVLTVLSLVLIAGAFYWYEYRPAEIRKGCMERTLEVAKRMLAQKHELYREAYQGEKSAADVKYMKGAVEKGFYSQNDFEAKYRDCLRGEGLEK